MKKLSIGTTDHFVWLNCGELESGLRETRPGVLNSYLINHVKEFAKEQMNGFKLKSVIHDQIRPLEKSLWLLSGGLGKKEEKSRR